MDPILLFIFYVFVATLALFVLFFTIITLNGFIDLKNRIDKAKSNIDVLLKQRHDEILNLVEIVKGYAKHEQNLFKEIANERITENKKLFAIKEKYPKIKADKNFLKLQKRISYLEKIIAEKREFYNNLIKNFNNNILQFPGFIFAKLMKLKPKDYLEF